MRDRGAEPRAGTKILWKRKDRFTVRYIVEGRRGDHWIVIGQPIADHARASKTMEMALESGEWQDARILVINKDRQIVKIID